MEHSQDRASSPAGLFVIGGFKLIKGLLLAAAGIGALKLLHKDLADVAMRWTDILRVDPGNRYIHGFLVRFLSLNERSLREISAGTFFYAALLLTEGLGLLLRQHWAEYFTLITTASLIPLEVLELVKKFSAAKLAVIGVNAAIVLYLIMNFRRQRRTAASA